MAKPYNPQAYSIAEARKKIAEIQLAKKYEKKLRSAFKGIYSYSVRKQLLDVGSKKHD